ncbi:hypothetical protein [Comamonas terrigena]|uniref:hypothetical protein n=1 Tax=Comamonas terrigena TaxID=32013 RepID=UPI0028AC68CF|nr:hypothetical protein [Comamonas terrigena]
MARTTRLLLHGSPAIHRALSHFLQHLLRWHGASGCMALFITLHRRIFLYCEILISHYEKKLDFCTFTGQKIVLHYEKLTQLFDLKEE